MIVYKLTDKDGYTRRGLSGETLWAPGVTRETSGEGDLCTPGWLHAYEHSILAVLHDPIYGEYGDFARMWKCDTLDGVIKRDGQMKLGTTKLKVIKEVKKPKVTVEQRVAYAIACSLRIYVEESYVMWAEGWLSGKDRTDESAWAAESAFWSAEEAAWAAMWAVRATTWAAAWATTWEAAREAARAAEEATWAVTWAAESATTWEAMSAARVVASAAAESASNAAASGISNIDLVDCAREVFLV